MIWAVQLEHNSTFVLMEKGQKNINKKPNSLGEKINDTLLINFSTEEMDCVETMHSRGRKLACLLYVSLLSGFVST